MQYLPRWSSVRYMSLNRTGHRQLISVPQKLPRFETFSTFPQRCTNNAIPQSGGSTKEYSRRNAYNFGTLSADSSTIFALSTAPGRAAIAIIRISGPACLDVSILEIKAETAVNLV